MTGANCAIVVGLAFGAAALLGAPRGVRVLAGLGALAGFVVLVSPEPSVVRAGAMAAIAMLAVALGRVGAGVAVLSLAVTVVLIADPWLAASLGFALSVAATAALLLAAAPLANGLSRWLPHPLALALSVPLAAQLACGPLLILIDPRVPVYGVLANLLAAPAAPAGTVLGLAACLTAGVPYLGVGLAALAWVPAAWVSATATTLAGLPAGILPWPDGVAGAVLLAVVGVCLAAVIAGLTGSRARAAAVLTLAAFVGGGVASGPITAAIDRAAIPVGWSIAACEVGQGDAVLIRSDATVALVDTGPDPAALTRCLDRFRIARIDLLVLTHFDVDHRGGVEAVVGRVGTVLHGPVPDEAGDARALQTLADGGARTVEVRAGVHGALGSARWRVLWPRAEERAFAPGNEMSVVLSLTGDGTSALFLGDLSAAAQRALLATAGVPARVDVVKVAHHGSADQEPALYERLAARVGLVTVGPNDYGHPRKSILDVLARVGTVALRTDTQGDLAVVPGPDRRLGVWRSRAESRREDAGPIGRDVRGP